MIPIALTPGEPAGIGPDIVAGLALEPGLPAFVVIADKHLLAERVALLGLDISIVDAAHEFHGGHVPGQLPVHHVPLAEPVCAGELKTANARYVLHTLELAVSGCSAGTYSAMTTGPVHKGIINDAGIPFSGHTEYLAALSDSPKPVMLLATRGLRVALATTHIPLSAVSAAITREELTAVLDVLLTDLRCRFAIANPRVLVCGLNPHAGEGGHLGREEIETIGPVLDEFRARGAILIGPLPADTVFTPNRIATADAVLAMYHDQGLPVLKHMGFGDAVNITLGLPFVRTSVDHGTAIDIAGSGRADPSSLRQALLTAQKLSSIPHGV